MRLASRKTIVGLSGGLAAVIVVAGTFLVSPHLFTSADEGPHFADGHGQTVHCLGRFEPGQGVINVSPGEGVRIDRLVVSQGQAVKQGDLLAETDGCDECRAERKFVEAQLQEARRQFAAETERGNTLIAEAEAGVERAETVQTLEVQAQKAQVRLYEQRLEEASRDYQRGRTMRRDTAVSREELDRQELAVGRLTHQVEVGKANLARLEAERKFSLLEAQARLAIARTNLLKAQRAIPLDSLDKRLGWIDARIDRLAVRAPLSGQVLRIFTWPGERIGSKPLLQMGDTAHMYAVAEVYETDVRFVQRGQRATVSSPALEQPLSGTVEQVGLRIYKNDVLNVDPRAETDSRVVEVRILLDNPAPAARLIYMQIDVSIDVLPRPGVAAINPSAAP